jgi:hypothetical protein
MNDDRAGGRANPGVPEGTVPWIIIDDVDAATGPPPPEPGHNDPAQATGWGPSGPQTWNGMNAAPPSAGPKSASLPDITSRDTGGDAAVIGSTSTPSDPADDWEVDQAPPRIPLQIPSGRKQRFALPSLWPSVVTVVVACLSVLLLTSSMLWHPRIP